ncbi:hypothetical protein [Breoghania sp. JC706]|uniref:hypothetical protein n=1 Tax=Breoghania sp. JC706 TaxID=3117732 RepID=UPI00300BB3C8
MTKAIPLNATACLTGEITVDSGDPTLTFAGMAHFGGAMADKLCRQCRFHGMSANRTYSRLTEEPRAFPCAKTRQLGLKGAPPVPVNAHACKYFEPK